MQSTRAVRVQLISKAITVIIATTIALSANAYANDGTQSNFAASLGLGTTGVSAGLFYRESPNFVTDANVGGVAIDPSFVAGGETYKMGINLLTAQLTENWYPFSNNMLISAGLLINNDKFNLQPTSVQGNYSYATPASFHFSPVAPYLGVGWGYPFSGSRWSFIANAGAAYEGSAHVSVAMGTDPYAQQAYQAEKSSISSAIGGYHWYPVATVGLVYRFG